MTDLSRIYQLSDDARYRRVAGEGVVLQQAASEVLMLNQTGADALELIDGERTVQAIIDTMAATHAAAPEVIARDVPIYIDQLIEAGVIRER
jgi:hypothetical protein